MCDPLLEALPENGDDRIDDVPVADIGNHAEQLVVEPACLFRDGPSRCRLLTLYENGLDGIAQPLQKNNVDLIARSWRKRGILEHVAIPYYDPVNAGPENISVCGEC